MLGSRRSPHPLHKMTLQSIHNMIDSGARRHVKLSTKMNGSGELNAGHQKEPPVSLLNSMKRPKLFWVSAGAPLASVIIATLLVFLFKAQNHGISIIGQLERGLNRPSWDKLLFNSSHLSIAMKTGLVTRIISLTEGVAVGRTFAALKDYQVAGNKEMMAIGLMNIVGSCTSCYVTTGSFSRSAVNHNAGCKTAMSNIVMAVTVMKSTNSVAKTEARSSKEEAS